MADWMNDLNVIGCGIVLNNSETFPKWSWVSWRTRILVVFDLLITFKITENVQLQCCLWHNSLENCSYQQHKTLMNVFFLDFDSGNIVASVCSNCKLVNNFRSKIVIWTPKNHVFHCHLKYKLKVWKPRNIHYYGECMKYSTYPVDNIHNIPFVEYLSL